VFELDYTLEGGNVFYGGTVDISTGGTGLGYQNLHVFWRPEGRPSGVPQASCGALDF
jgi:hypothetical protein